jgi:uncharacterized phage-associated protein
MLEQVFAGKGDRNPPLSSRGMTVAAQDVAAALRDRLPGLPVVKLHKLLYYCQGVHLAHTGEPLFADTISAWDMGPVVVSLWRAEDEGLEPPPVTPLTNSQLGTVGYVVSRYGWLSGSELATLTHHEDPWRRGDEDRARRGRRGAAIKIEWIRDWFSARGDDDGDLDSLAIRQWLSEPSLPLASGAPDEPEAIAAWAYQGG